MTILPDGRWRMSSAELTNKVWLQLKNWKLDPADDRCLIPDFPPCTRRSLELLCTTCGRAVNQVYYCNKFETKVSVNYCKGCAEGGKSEPVQPSSAEISGPTESNNGQVPGSRPDLLGAESTDS